MKFKRSDGILFEADPGSASAKMMQKDGGFELLEDDGKSDYPIEDDGKSDYPLADNAAAGIAKTNDASAEEKPKSKKAKKPE